MYFIEYILTINQKEKCKDCLTVTSLIDDVDVDRHGGKTIVEPICCSNL